MSAISACAYFENSIIQGETQMTKKALLVFAMTILLCAFGWSVARPPTPEEGWENAQLQVLKVFSARDGDAIFRAYMVNWKGQEVVVRDTLAKTDYHVG